MCGVPYGPAVAATTSYASVTSPTSAAVLYSPAADTSFLIVVAFDEPYANSGLTLAWTDSLGNSRTQQAGGSDNVDGTIYTAAWPFAFRAKGGTNITTKLTGTDTVNAWVYLLQF